MLAQRKGKFLHELGILYAHNNLNKNLKKSVQICSLINNFKNQTSIPIWITTSNLFV